MDSELESRAVAKLVLLEQACCDPNLSGSHRGVLAVILDACYDKPRCYIGPTAIGQVAGLDPRTVRACIRELGKRGYLRQEARTKRSDWYYPNFAHAEQTGCLVERPEGLPMRVHRPASNDGKAGLRVRHAGLQIPQCGPTDPSMRVHRPEEAVLEAVPEAIKEAVTPAASSFDDWIKQQQGDDELARQRQEQQRLAEEERKAERQASIRQEYLECRATHPGHAKAMERTFPKELADLIEARP